MKLTLATNIGKPDAKRLGLDFAEAKRGKEVNVKNDVADILLKNGWAVQTSADGTKVEPAKATETAPDFDGMTLEELRTFAKDNGIEGASSLNKDDTLKLVKKNFNKVR